MLQKVEFILKIFRINNIRKINKSIELYTYNIKDRENIYLQSKNFFNYKK